VKTGTSTNAADCKQRISRAYNPVPLRHLRATAAMSKTQELADRVERLLLRHEELKRTNELIEQQLTVLTQERDNLRSRLNAARSRIDALLQRLPTETAAAVSTDTPGGATP
jgi:cell division protein ZapB